eukprot:scaffold24471_cov51-Attheya_sp.AAC.2
MEAPEQVSEPHAHYMTPTADTPDRRRYAVASVAATVLLQRFYYTAVMIDVTGGDGWVWCLLTFPLLKLKPLRLMATIQKEIALWSKLLW